MSWNTSIPTADWYVPGDERLDGLVREILDQDVVAIDTETTGLCVFRDVPLYWSLAWGEHRRCAMPVSTLGYFASAFKDPTLCWAFANAKFDAHMLANRGVTIAGPWYDVQVMHALLYEELVHKLKVVALQILGWTWREFFDVFKPELVPDYSKPAKHLKNGRISQPTRKETNYEVLTRAERENLPALVDYASNDAYGTLQLFYALKKELENENTYSLYSGWIRTLADLFFFTEAPFTKVLWKMERNGFYVDKPYLTSLGDPMGVEINQLSREIQRLANEAGMTVFNPNSVDDKRHYFIDIKKLRPLMMTDGGKTGNKQASIDKTFLERYEGEDDMAHLLVRYSKLTKLKSTYIDNVDEYRDTSGRIHTKYNQDVARTGRLSSSDPNLQNVPTPDKDIFKLRGAFRPQPGAGTTLIVGDYKALEMRLLACATVTPSSPQGEEKMIQIFKDGKDIHMGNAVTVFGPIYKQRFGWDLTYDFIKEAKKIDGQVKEGKLPRSALTERHALALLARNQIKSATFGMVYGMKASKLARQLGITKEAAQAIIDAFMQTYPAVQSYFDETVALARKFGASWTILGRRRCHPHINNPFDAFARWAEEREATNNGIQGVAADVVRLAMIAIDKAKLDEKYNCFMILQVHDELGFECPEETAEMARAEIKEIMEHALPKDLIVALEVDIGMGMRWDQAK